MRKARNGCLPSTIFQTNNEYGQPKLNWVSQIWLTPKTSTESPLLGITVKCQFHCQSEGSVLKIPLYYVCTYIHT